MRAIEVYQHYIAIYNYFTKNYDYFKYGRIKTTALTYDRRKDKMWFEKIAKENDPIEFMAANMIFNQKIPHVTNMSRDKWLQLHKYMKNGPYLFAQDLFKLKKSFNDNFTVDSDNTVPYIVQLYMNEEVSIHTMCVFETLLHMDAKWQKTPLYIIFGDVMKKVCKSAPFFKIDTEVYRPLVLKYFSE